MCCSPVGECAAGDRRSFFSEYKNFSRYYFLRHRAFVGIFYAVLNVHLSNGGF